MSANTATLCTILGLLPLFSSVRVTFFSCSFSDQSYPVVGLSLTSIAQRVVDATGDIVNFSPLIMLCATLIQHNKAQSRVSHYPIYNGKSAGELLSQDFLPYTETLLRVVVTKAGIDEPSICRLLHITGSLFRKIEPREQAFLSNHVLVTFLHTVAEALSGKLRIAPSTLAASVQVSSRVKQRLH